ncbi:SH3 domain-containing protein [Sporolactobacillus sp. STSJ-5]|uniref:SH3 domain-containing protein n=1 Tax=Sporolactobacillus sp. STSJ-5 TaxID=2965076 RepID=UPI002106AAD0|nr:SH3 domain-containing protein [Sporolactobacillus sp. STSJ-5]MCQ2010432.1 SH3 domain-containing protein [Sporolactobacillus sp. STSJ-5]
MKKIVTGALVAVLLLASFGIPLGGQAHASSSYSAYVKTYTLKVRNKASKKFKVLRTLNMGNKVKVTSIHGSYSRISYKGTTGYVQSKHISRTKFGAYPAYVTAYTLKVRSKASIHYSVKQVLSMSNQVSVIGKGNKYALISANGVTGYVRNQCLTTTPFAARTAFVTSPTLKVRDHASTKYTVLRTARFRDQVQITGMGKKYAQVQFDNATGYVQAAYLSNTRPAEISYFTTQYPYPLDVAVNRQLNASAQTDNHYTMYVPKDSLTFDGIQWTVNGNTDVRGGADGSAWIVKQVKQGAQLSNDLVKPVDGNDSWFQIGTSMGWVNASPNDLRSMLDPNSFSNTSPEFYQFLNLSTTTSVNADEINNNILNGKGILAGKAATFIQAASDQHINEIYLIAHALLETGNGTSQLATGQLQGTGTDGQLHTVYNMFGIGATDDNPNQAGADFAARQGWFTPEAAILGGAQFIAQSYINSAAYHQDTLYKMRWNPANTQTASHQYATDIGWAVKQARIMNYYYGKLSGYTLRFELPKY